VWPNIPGQFCRRCQSNLRAYRYVRAGIAEHPHQIFIALYPMRDFVVRWLFALRTSRSEAKGTSLQGPNVTPPVHPSLGPSATQPQSLQLVVGIVVQFHQVLKVEGKVDTSPLSGVNQPIRIAEQDIVRRFFHHRNLFPRRFSRLQLTTVFRHPSFMIN